MMRWGVVFLLVGGWTGAAVAVDSDSDGIDDAVEVELGSNPAVPDADLDADGDGLSNAEELANAYDPLDAADPGQVTEPRITLFASLLPTSRSIRTDATATVFAMLLNAGTNAASECRVVLQSPVPGAFFHQATDLETNAIVAARNESQGIAPGGAATFLLGITPSAAFAPMDVTFGFRCTNGADAPVVTGLNTLQLSATVDPVTDVIALAATVSNDGVLHLDATSGAGAFAVAAANVGAAEMVTVAADTGTVTLPAALYVCATDIGGACLEPPAESVSLNVVEGATPSVAVFATASESIAFDPASHRVFVRFRDTEGVVRGSTSVAIEGELAWSLDASAPESTGISAADRDAILNHLFTDSAVQGAVLLKDGYTIGERYAPGHDENDLVHSWSIAKSFYAAAVAAAVDDGLITSFDVPVSAFVPDWQVDERRTVTLRDLLRMRSGLTGNSGCGGTIFWANDQTAHAVGSTFTPSSEFDYSNCASQVLEPILHTATGLSAHDWLRTRILNRIGIADPDVGFWFDRIGEHALIYTGIDMTIRNFARFGLMVARGGEWQGEAVLTRERVDEMLYAPAGHWYGLHWVALNANYYLGNPPPIDAWAAMGFDGQWIIVLAEYDLVLAVFTRYVHDPASGFVLSDTNFPNTCSARGSCATGGAGAVPPFDDRQLLDLLYRALTR